MNKLILRLYIVEKGEYINVRLDKRLSFADNFILLGQLYDYDFSNRQVVDPKIKKALLNDVPLCSFNFPAFMTLFIY